MQMELITDQVYAVPGLSMGRVYVIAGKDGLTVVDASYAPNTAEKLETQLKSLGFGLGNIKNILITHAHPDHIGGLADLQRRTNARTMIHHRDAAAARGEMPLVRPRLQDVAGAWRLMAAVMPTPAMPPVRIDKEVKEGDTFDDILPGLQVIETPGHSPGQVGYWWPEKRLLFGGDVMMRMVWGLMLPVPAFTVNMSEAKRSIRKVAGMNLDILCFGHGRPLIGNAAAQIHAFAGKLRGE
jgi:glyoxylase-like metal-dependent hydrolase (beta-lactamase superfamily II)